MGKMETLTPCKIETLEQIDGRHIENRLLAISQRMIIGLTQNFVG